MHGASLKAHQRTYNKNSYFRIFREKKTLTFANSKKTFARPTIMSSKALDIKNPYKDLLDNSHMCIS